MTMPDTITPLAPEREIEARAGVESLATLQAERRRLLAEFAPLDALFGNNNKGWESARKRHRAGIMMLIEGEQGAMAENKLERLANADPRHVRFVEETEAKQPRWYQLKNELAEIEERIESRKAEIYYAGREASLS